MLIHIYWNTADGTVVVPTVAKTEAGYWLDVEPVECASLADPSPFVTAVREAMARSGKVVPTPSSQNFPKPVVHSHAKVRSMREFERKYDQISLVRDPDGSFSIEQYTQAPGGSGRVVDCGKSALYPSGTSLDHILEELLDVISFKRN
jgi:hypothetical protein